MDLELGIAGFLALALGLGHEALGVRWVLPHVTEDRLEKTPFGPAGMTTAMVHVTWHIVTIFALSLAMILLILAFYPAADAKQVFLRVIAVAWLAAATVSIGDALRRVRDIRRLLRLPVPMFFVAVAILCWAASS